MTKEVQAKGTMPAGAYRIKYNIHCFCVKYVSVARCGLRDSANDRELRLQVV